LTFLTLRAKIVGLDSREKQGILKTSHITNVLRKAERPIAKN
ncbi:MAG: hypothetical protein ACD_15C00196G0001, partial [uncultured bacterium]